MSSTSSSECECKDYDNNYWEYEHGYNTNAGFRDAFGRNPFYPTMGHPLVYYAQVPQPISRKHRARDRRDKPNCFVKAFRWYTEEHKPSKNVSPINKPDMTGFATWLDQKYDEFLQESRPASELLHIKMKQTSTFEAERITKNANDCEPCGTKKCRTKSPWKKKRRAKSNETGDAGVKSNQSLQYILQPKDLSRPVSQCCHPSNATVVSQSKKSMVRSRSYSNTTAPRDTTDTTPGQEVEINVCQYSACQSIICRNIDISKQSFKSSAENNVKTQDFECQCSEKKTAIADVGIQYTEVINPAKASRNASKTEIIADMCGCELPSRPPNKFAYKRTRNVECQCPEEKIVKVDLQTQSEFLETRPASTATVHKCCNCDFKEFIRNNQPSIQSTSNVTQCTCERNISEALAKDKQPVGVIFSQNAAQTSNHSIHLEKETVCVHEYPLFMKIVCADRLSKENMQ